MRELLERLARPEDRSIWALIAVITAYGVWGLAVGFRRNRRAEPAPPDAQPAAPANGD
ncbi:MAG: hypothetical protein KUG77_10780 [Nannocystaceae bacterium]|nr:hypothetical protein [Nannocystaceae bacterium]